MSRARLIAITLAAFAPGLAAAETIRIEAERCPVNVDIAPLVSEDVGAFELNPWAGRFDDVLLRRDVPLRGNGLLFLRLYPDLATGEIFEPVEPACAPEATPLE